MNEKGGSLKEYAITTENGTCIIVTPKISPALDEIQSLTDIEKAKITLTENDWVFGKSMDGTADAALHISCGDKIVLIREWTT